MIKIDSCHFENCGVGISTPENANLEITGNRFVLCGKAVDIRDSKGLAEAIGIRPDTPVAVIRELLEFVRDQDADETQVQQKVQRSAIKDWLSTGANIATVVTALKDMAPFAAQVIAMLPK